MTYGLLKSARWKEGLNQGGAMKTKKAFSVTGKVSGTILVMALAAVSLTAAPEDTAPATAGANAAEMRLVKQVRHELLMVPFYGVFDSLSFAVQGPGTVILSGAVTRPTLRSDAERAVARLEGVAKVVNNIEVLPLS